MQGVDQRPEVVVDRVVVVEQRAVHVAGDQPDVGDGVELERLDGLGGEAGSGGGRRGGQVRFGHPGILPLRRRAACRGHGGRAPGAPPDRGGLGMMRSCPRSTGSTAPAPTPPGSWRRRPPGLEWIRVPGGPRVPAIVEVGPSRLGMERVAEGRPTREMAEQFGRQLAVLHGSGAPSYGCPPPGAPGPDGWIGDLPMPYAARNTFAGVLGARPDRCDRPDGPRPRRAGRGAGGGGRPVRRRPPRRRDRRRSARSPGARARRPVERQRPLGRRRARVAHRSGRPRWPPRVRPRDARAVRSAPSRPDHRRLPGGPAAGARLAGTDPPAPGLAAAGPRRPVRRRLRRLSACAALRRARG